MQIQSINYKLRQTKKESHKKDSIRNSYPAFGLKLKDGEGFFDYVTRLPYFKDLAKDIKNAKNIFSKAKETLVLTPERVINLDMSTKHLQISSDIDSNSVKNSFTNAISGTNHKEKIDNMSKKLEHLNEKVEVKLAAIDDFNLDDKELNDVLDRATSALENSKYKNEIGLLLNFAKPTYVEQKYHLPEDKKDKTMVKGLFYIKSLVKDPLNQKIKELNGPSVGNNFGCKQNGHDDKSINFALQLVEEKIEEIFRKKSQIKNAFEDIFDKE